MWVEKVWHVSAYDILYTFNHYFQLCAQQRLTICQPSQGDPSEAKDGKTQHAKALLMQGDIVMIHSQH